MAQLHFVLRRCSRSNSRWNDGAYADGPRVRFRFPSWRALERQLPSSHSHQQEIDGRRGGAHAASALDGGDRRAERAAAFVHIFALDRCKRRAQ